MLQDVLMVWHSHMLNPRAYLEDCMRAGLRGLWSGGMPWHLVDRCIDIGCNYIVQDEVKRKWTATTDRAWDNVHDSMHKSIKCPACQFVVDIPWTTCGAEEGNEIEGGLVGYGYGDGELSYACPACACVIDKKLLSLFKFITDTKALVTHYIPMPGTVLHPSTGKPEAWETRGGSRKAAVTYDPVTFPNRLIKQVLLVRILQLSNDLATTQPRPDMESVRRIIEETMKDTRGLEWLQSKLSTSTRARLAPVSRLVVRKMMSRYWENFTPFALDLGGAVMRQGIFVEKMYQIDWLHSPIPRVTMDRLCKKYTRFVTIMASGMGKQLAVPTLDVDLAWHTHQLTPAAYYASMVAKTKRFVDHDDKIEEDKLDDAFQWTSKAYQDMFHEVYSECTCWYCESVRSSHISSLGHAFGLSKQEKRKSLSGVWMPTPTAYSSNSV